ncbi:1-deoxy-D-xylulose-5-phosphate synthase, partial [Candidatus Margulisiibacteriota bacterium]
MRISFIDTLIKEIDKGHDIYLLTADLGFGLFDQIREKYPERFINVGVAEQNMVSVAAGMALDGKIVFCYSMIPFLLMRAFEQIRVDVCNHFLNVRFIGVGSGYG